MKRGIRKLLASHKQTKIFVFTIAIYFLIIIWTTIQAFLRLEFNRTGVNHDQILISQPIEQK
jgi:hypothetical protein